MNMRKYRSMHPWMRMMIFSHPRAIQIVETVTSCGLLPYFCHSSKMALTFFIKDGDQSTHLSLSCICICQDDQGNTNLSTKRWRLKTSPPLKIRRRDPRISNHIAEIGLAPYSTKGRAGNLTDPNTYKKDETINIAICMLNVTVLDVWLSVTVMSYLCGI
jgi:hypothetical protein